MTDGPWEMFAGGDDGTGRYLNVGDRHYVEMYGREPIPVLVTEDPDGPYYGWMGFARLHYKADECPVMIQPREVLFNIQFTYGPDAEVERDHGRVVRLSITERT